MKKTAVLIYNQFCNFEIAPGRCMAPCYKKYTQVELVFGVPEKKQFNLVLDARN